MSAQEVSSRNLTLIGETYKSLPIMTAKFSLWIMRNSLLEN